MAYSVTEAFVDWLSAGNYEASTYPPKDGSEFVTIERTGGEVSDMVDHPQIAIQTWAQTATRAEEMANEIRLALYSSRPSGVYSAFAESLYPFYDEETRLPRYQLVLNCAAQLTE